MRVAAVIILGLTFLGILLQPKIKKAEYNISILITENAIAKQVDSLINHYQGASVVSLGSDRGMRSSTELSSVNELGNERINLVVGDGLSPSAADILSGTQFNYRASALPVGIINLVIPDNVTVLTKNSIEGVVNNDRDSVKIVLEGPGGKEDSVTLTETGTQKFKLEFTPKQAGKFLYSISIAEKKEILPIKVAPERKIKILVVQMFPTFETGYLKNLLAEDHELVFRYQLSKNNFRYEYINHPSIRTDRLSAEILDDFDLLVIDSDALSQLSAAERKNMESSTLSGLGILLLQNESPVGNLSVQSLLPVAFKPFAYDTACFQLNRKITLPAWAVQAVNNGQIIPVIENKKRILAGYVYHGFGKIGFNLLQETYKLALEGDSASYENLWTTTVQKNARNPKDNFRITIKNDFPIHPKEPLSVEVIGSAAEAPTLLHNGREISMSEHLVVDDIWTTKIWPENSGWHELHIKGDSARQCFYVSEESAWKSLASANAIRRTKAMASTAPVEAAATWEYKPFAQWVFYAMFLVAAALLWLVPKM
ncbi:MAG TPA: hypothetical protein VGD65_09685 [Chryseosolibacter sp.]